jgi:Fe-S-cluster containining protein
MSGPPRIRRDLIAGPHPEDQDRWLVFCPRTGDHFEFPAYGWKIAEALDGTREPSDLARNASELAGVRVAPEAVLAFASKLAELGLFETEDAVPIRLPKDGGPQWTVEPPPRRAEIWVHEDAAYRCWCAGTCCGSGYVVSLDREEAARVRAAGLRILSDRDPLCLLPRSAGAPWTWALANDPSCPFLDEELRCRIHGTDALPATCDVYPLAFVRFRDTVYASVTHRCVCGALDEGPPLSSQRESLERKLSVVKHVPVLSERTRLDAYTQLATEQVVDALIACTESAFDPWELLVDAIEGLRASAVEVDVGGEVEDPDVLFDRLGARLDAASDLTLAAALGRRRHPNHGPIEEGLHRAGLHRPLEDPRRECVRFLRDYLSGLRIYRFTTLADGLLAAALALHSILAGDPSHPLARERIMLWEDAMLSPVLRALLGADGPLAPVSASIANVARQVDRLSSGHRRM